MTAINNIDVALMGKVVELAERFGINPCSFIATVRMSDKGSILCFETPPSAENDGPRFDAMLQAMGLNAHSESSLTLELPDEALYERLQSAIDKAPKRRAR